MSSDAQPTPALDGVRGIAFLTVLLSHANSFTSMHWFLTDGQVGVWLFFVLSSFLLARPWFAAPSELLIPTTWFRYLVRRFLRIYPLFLLYLAALYLIAHVPAGKCLRILRLDTFHAVDWSLFVEFRFYLLLPLLFLPLALGLPRRIHLALLVLLTLGCCLAFPFWRPHESWLWAGLPVSGWSGNAYFLSYLNCFLVGMLAAAFANGPAWPRSARWADLVSLLTLLALLALPYLRVFTAFGAGIEDARFSHFWFPYALLFALWILLLTRAGGTAATVLAMRPLRFLGDISYPGYLSHLFVFFLLKPVRACGDFTYLLTALSSCIALSWLLHVLVEKPLYRLRPRH